MTAETRIFLRRHYRAFCDLVPGKPIEARRATARVGYGAGISITHLSEFFGIGWGCANNDVFATRTRGAYLTRWKQARLRTERARRVLRLAEGLERSAMERAVLRGWELPV